MKKDNSFWDKKINRIHKSLKKFYKDSPRFIPPIEGLQHAPCYLLSIIDDLQKELNKTKNA